MPEQKKPSNNNTEESEKLPDVRGGLEFGKDATNAYAGDVGYDDKNVEYTTEIREEEDSDDDEGVANPSHPSTLQRIMVRKNTELIAALPPKSHSFFF